MNFEIETGVPEEEELVSLYESVGWTAYTCEPGRLFRAVRNSRYCYFVRIDGILSGLVRGVGDGETIVYVQDLLVRPDNQRKGIGSALLKRLLAETKQIRQTVLLTDSTSDKEAFYQKCGLQPASQMGCGCFVIL